MKYSCLTMFQVYSQVIQFPLYIHVCVGVCGCVCVSALNHGWLFVIWWTVARQAPLSVGFSRQEYWRRLPFPPPEDLSSPGIEPTSLVSPALAGEFFTIVPPGKALYMYCFTLLKKCLLLLLLLSHCSRVRLCATPETAAHQASPSLGFSRQEHWSGLPLSSPWIQIEDVNYNFVHLPKDQPGG